MRAKSLILLTVALGCGMVAAVAVSKTLMEKNGAAAEEATVEILVAVHEIKNASKISAEKVKLEKWPKSKLPEGSITNIKDIDGKYASQNLYPGEPILTQKLSDSNNSVGTTIPAGFTIFDVPYENNYIKPGDWVDISGTFTPAGKTKSPEVRTVLKGVQVFAINGNPDRNTKNEGGKGTIFNLLIKQTQHQALLLAHKMGSLDLNIRPLNEDGNIKEGGEDNGQHFLDWARDQAVPATGVDSLEKHVSTTIVPPAPPQSTVQSPKKNEILILSPGGVKRYEYAGQEMPREVDQNAQDTKVPAIPSNPWQTGSGYGGYSPTYPTTYANPTSVPTPDGSSVTSRPGQAAVPMESSKPAEPKLIN